jgi:hypothetical protein
LQVNGSWLGFGHGACQLTIPLGVRAELDADAGTLTLAEPDLGSPARLAPSSGSH